MIHNKAGERLSRSFENSEIQSVIMRLRIRKSR